MLTLNENSSNKAPPGLGTSNTAIRTNVAGLDFARLIIVYKARPCPDRMLYRNSDGAL